MSSRLFRLYGKKRGHRLSGWWLAGRVGEAFWFATIFMLGVFSLSGVVAWQVLSPETHAFPVGYGFWLLVLLTSTFVGIGAVGFFYRVVRVAFSEEHRSVLASRGLRNRLPSNRSKKSEPHLAMVPSLVAFTDSPGVKLAYRLPIDRPEVHRIILGSIFVLAWSALVAILVAIAIGRFATGNPDWFLNLVIIPFFTYIAVRVSRWFYRAFRVATGIGATTVEISDLPLYPGESYRLSLVQYGRLALRKLSIELVCEEIATYHFGTDTRTDRHEVFRRSIYEQGRFRIDWGRPLEINIEFNVPMEAMHSFQSLHNSVTWKIVVQGEANRWPSYCRSFPVVVYPKVSPKKMVEAVLS